MKKLPITKEAFEKSKYFQNKYGKLEYVSESGKLFKTNKGKIMKFKESIDNGGEKIFLAGCYNLEGGDVYEVEPAYSIDEAIDYIVETFIEDKSRRDPDFPEEFNVNTVRRELKEKGWTKLNDFNIAFISSFSFDVV